MTDPSPTGVGHTLPSTPNTNTDTNRLINDSDSPGSTDNTVGGISLVNSALPGRSSQPIQDDQLLLVDEKDVNTVADNASMSTTESKPTVNDRSGKGDGKGKGKWKDKVEGFGTSTIATLKKAAGLIQHDVDHDSVTYKDTDRNTALSVPNGVSEGEANTLNTDHALPRTRSAAPKLSQDSDGSEVIETHTDTLDVLSNAHSFADDVPDGEKRRKTWDDLDASDGESDDTNEKATRSHTNPRDHTYPKRPMRRLFSHTLHKLKNESKLDLMTRVHRLESDKDEMSLRLSSLKDSSKRMARSLWQRTYWYYLALMLVIFAVTPQGVLPEVVDDMSRNATATMLGYHPIDYMFPAERGVSGGSLGRRLAAEGLQKHHPVLLIPGFTTVSLELWKPHPDCPQLPRARLWGTLSMPSNVASNLDCWLRQMSLDPEKGLDPEDIKLRAVDGFSGSTEFNEYFWIWNMVIDNLVAVGYDNGSLGMVGYDWRMSFGGNEKRDGSLSKIKATIEFLYTLNGDKKVVIVGHSMGGHLVTYFMKWVESDLGGKGGKGWVAKHLHAFVGLASSALGMPKSVGALLSGEFKDTSALGGLNHLIDSNTLLGRAARAKLLQTWRSMYQMMPKGGDALWGNGIDSVDDFGENGTCHYMLTVFPNDAQNQKCRDGCSTPVPNFLTDGYSEMCERDEMMPNVTMSTFLDHFLTSQFANTAPILKQFSYGYSDTPEDNDDDPLKWYNALEFQLPNAPDMTIYSIYGIGKNTERGYAYQAALPLAERAGYTPLRYHINVTKVDGLYHNGVCMHTGDGTVPLLSLGYLSATQWRTPTHNPHGVRIVTREIVHKPHPLFPRGGEHTGDHVDILGNIDLNEDVVRIACGEALKDNYHSYIREIGKAAHKRLQAAASRQLKRRSRRQDKTQQQPQAASVGARVAEKVAEYIPGL